MGNTLDSTLPDCDRKVYRKGEHIATVIDLEPEEIEDIIKSVARESGQKVDWHYFGGRAVVKALGDLAKVRACLKSKLQSYEGKYRFTTENDSVIPWPQ